MVIMADLRFRSRVQGSGFGSPRDADMVIMADPRLGSRVQGLEASDRVLETRLNELDSVENTACMLLSADGPSTMPGALIRVPPPPHSLDLHMSSLKDVPTGFPAWSMRNTSTRGSSSPIWV
jgi:hypothetical protein